MPWECGHTLMSSPANYTADPRQWTHHLHMYNFSITYLESLESAVKHDCNNPYLFFTRFFLLLLGFHFQCICKNKFKSMAWCKTAAPPLLTHWSYCSLAAKPLKWSMPRFNILNTRYNGSCSTKLSWDELNATMALSQPAPSIILVVRDNRMDI